MRNDCFWVHHGERYVRVTDEEERASSSQRAAAAVELLSVASCQEASFSVEQNENKCVLRNNPAKRWPHIEFFFIFNDFVAPMNLKCKMKYLSTIKNRHVWLCCPNSMLLSSQRVHGFFRRTFSQIEQSLLSGMILWNFNPMC